MVDEEGMLTGDAWMTVPPSEIERYSMLVWSVLVAVFSLLGNTTVLLSSLHYNAIKLDRTCVILIRNLAIADLGFTMHIILTIGPILRREYVYSETFCRVSALAYLFFGSVDVTFICALNISKLTSLLFPIEARVRSARAGHIIAALIWLTPLFFIGLYLLGGGITPVFFSTTFWCETETTSQLGEAVYTGIMLCFGVLPTLLIIGATLWLLCFVHHVHGLARQGVQTILVVSTAFFVSFTPYGGVVLLKALLSADAKSSAEFIVFFRFAVYLMYFNYGANPLIYYVSIRSFRQFVDERLLRRRSNRTRQDPCIPRSTALTRL